MAPKFTDKSKNVSKGVASLATETVCVTRWQILHFDLFFSKL
jgi:hypothetical protein